MMVEPDGGGSDSFSVQSPENRQLLIGEEAANYHPYPPPLNTYEDVVASRELFMDTLKKLHSSMGTKFMVPIVGGKDLDLYQLFVEVTSRGGISKVLKEKKWKDVTAAFTFPSSATNASFILRKYYISLLYHCEQIYFFKAKCWTPMSSDALHHSSTIAPPTANVVSPSQQFNTVTLTPPPPAGAGSAVCGVIDGKFDGGYLITVKIGTEDFKGVLYQVPSTEPQVYPNHKGMQQCGLGDHNTTSEKQPGKRKRRKKSEMRKRDPAHPKPNRSGYNFFFAEQHARLKPLYSGRDREISKMIGELWNKSLEPERAVYQEKAFRDKERYKVEMEEYKEQLKTSQVVPQCPSFDLTNLDVNPQSGENETSDDGEKSEDWDLREYSRADMELRNVNVEISADEEASFQLQMGPDMNGGHGGDQDKD